MFVPKGNCVKSGPVLVMCLVCDKGFFFKHSWLVPQRESVTCPRQPLWIYVCHNTYDNLCVMVLYKWWQEDQWEMVSSAVRVCSGIWVSSLTRLATLHLQKKCLIAVKMFVTSFPLFWLLYLKTMFLSSVSSMFSWNGPHFISYALIY